ncbi:MAG: DUF1775 domain-containing protein [Pseudomonadales bacterium]|nr:DUF1775 domain-containing protein [Pseudomonadales bacterium]
MATVSIQSPWALGITFLGAAFSQSALAHVSVTSPKAFSNAYYQVDMAVPHGCSGADTYRIEVSIPESLTGVRAVLGELGYAELETNPSTGQVNKLIWEKPDSDLLDSDSHAYNISFRTKLPDVAFTALHFPTVQYCIDSEGVESSSEWIGTGGHGHHGGSSDELPAPALFIYPPRSSGWNQYIAPDHLHDMSIFKDAEIVWKGSAAYSPNPHTQSLIENDAEASVLDAIHPGEEFWVKY